MPNRDRSPDEEQWYWDLHQQRAVRATERGAADHLLGPYPTEAAAQAWRERVERRNEAWDDADEQWREGDPDDRSGSRGDATEGN